MNPPADGETVNPPTEGESKKMSKWARWRRNKKEKLLSDKEEEEKEEVFLCTLVSDLLFCIPRSSYYSWDKGTTREMLVGLKMCRGDWCEGNGVAMIDLRGQPAVYAERIFVEHIFSSSRSEIRCLKVRVGCKKHGLGRGELKKRIIEVLALDSSIKWAEEENVRHCRTVEWRAGCEDPSDALPGSARPSSSSAPQHRVEPDVVFTATTPRTTECKVVMKRTPFFHPSLSRIGISPKRRRNFLGGRGSASFRPRDDGD